MRIDQIEDACNMMYTLLALYKGKNKQSNNTCSRHAISLYIHNMATQFLTYYKHYAYIYVYILYYIYILYISAADKQRHGCQMQLMKQ